MLIPDGWVCLGEGRLVCYTPLTVLFQIEKWDTQREEGTFPASLEP